MRREARVKIHSASDIVAARRQARAMASEAGFSICDSTLITTAVSEMSRNILEYAEQGDATISLLKNGTKSGVQIVVQDCGPGSADITQVMQNGYTIRELLAIG